MFKYCKQPPVHSKLQQSSRDKFTHTVTSKGCFLNHYLGLHGLRHRTLKLNAELHSFSGSSDLWTWMFWLDWPSVAQGKAIAVCSKSWSLLAILRGTSPTFPLKWTKGICRKTGRAHHWRGLIPPQCQRRSQCHPQRPHHQSPPSHPAAHLPVQWCPSRPWRKWGRACDRPGARWRSRGKWGSCTSANGHRLTGSATAPQHQHHQRPWTTSNTAAISTDTPQLPATPSDHLGCDQTGEKGLPTKPGKRVSLNRAGSKWKRNRNMAEYTDLERTSI